MGTVMIKQATIVDPASGKMERGDILIRDEKIELIQKQIKFCPDDLVIQGEGLIAGPGLVDIHVHLRDPGQTHKEDLVSACRAAAAGGVTSLLAMPNTSPPLDSPKAVRDLLDRAQHACVKIYTSACITKGMRGEALSDFYALNHAGAIAVTDDGKPVENTRLLTDALALAQDIGLKLLSHCEDLYLSDGGLMHEGETSRRLNIKGISRAAEDCATAREIAAAEAVGASVHICHVSTKGSVAIIRDAKRRGVSVTAETAPHYLLLTDHLLSAMDADYRMSPPLRTEEDRIAVIDGVLDGTIDLIATDHAPHTVEEKSNFVSAPNGVIGMETALAVVWTALKERCPPIEIFRLMSLAPAALLGIPAGKLQVGEDADIVLFDPNAKWKVDPDRLHGKSKNTPFKGMQLQGKVKRTFCRGQLIYTN